MTNIDKVIETFISGDYFIIFLLLILIIIIVLIICLLKTREENKLLISHIDNEEDYSLTDGEDFVLGLESLKATSKDDIIDEDKPLIKQISVTDIKTNDDDEDKPLIRQISVPDIKTYDDIIDEYESSEEENAVISASELEKKTKERLDALGTNDNRIAIEKYEEDQENKAIISYEQLLKNAQNISLTYKKEELKGKGAPKVNKIELEQKEVSKPESYLKEEEFLKILKDFRMSL